MIHTDKKHPDQERALSRRKQVLDAAEICFGSSGFHGASMAEISKAAGMSAGHIYNYFDNKDAIVAAFVQLNVERVTALIDELDQGEDPLQAIYDDLEKSIRADLHPGVWKLPLEIFAEASRNPKIAALIEEADAYTRCQFRQILIKGREARGLKTDLNVLEGRMEVIISMFQGLPVRVLHHPKLDQTALIAAFRQALAPLLFGE
jgi:AcrR family transcriptional regulator